MIKRDLKALDFIKQKPIDVEPLGEPLRILSDFFIPVRDDVPILTIGGEGVTPAFVSSDHRVTISNLEVTDSINIPPIEGQMRCITNGDDMVIQVYNTDIREVSPNNPSGGVWVNLGPTIQNNPPRKSKWFKFKNFFKKL